MQVSAAFARGRDTARLAPDDYRNTASAYSLNIAHVRAVVHVEAAGAGFWNNGNMKLLYEGHIADRETRDEPKLNAKLRAAGVSWRSWGGKKYGKASVSRDRLRKALAIAGPRAFRWASYGLPQTMGFNAELMRFADAHAMFGAYLNGESEQLDGLMRFVKGAGLLGKLRRKDWHGFARGYNGSGYAKHGYHTRLAAAYASFAKQKDIDAMSDGVLRHGETGAAVRALQENLNTLFGSDLEPDGHFGRATEQSVYYAQGRLGLTQDGVAGPLTLAAIDGAKEAHELQPPPSISPLPSPPAVPAPPPAKGKLGPVATALAAVIAAVATAIGIDQADLLATIMEALK